MLPQLRRAAGVLALGFAVLCLIPAVASAVDVRKGGANAGSDLEVIAGDEDNNLSITGDWFFSDKFWIEDTKANVTAVPGGGCYQENAHKVSCSGVTGIPDTADFYVYAAGGNDIVSSVKRAHLYGGDGDDLLKNPDESIFNCGYHDARLYGEGGNDQLEAGCDRDFLSGGPGDDKLYGHGDDDSLYGDEGNDLMDGGDGGDFFRAGEGADDMIGWWGWDHVEYGGRNTTTYVTLDDMANDGGVAEDANRSDNVHGDIESVATGDGNDMLVGNDWDNRLFGGAGVDSMEGKGGNDSLDTSSGNDYYVFGGEGDDDLFGTEGDDTLNGGNGDDYVSGGEGNDRVAGGLGRDDITGGPGDGDRATYGNGTAVTASLDGVRNDGNTGENDLIFADVEGIEGSEGADHLYGNDGPNVLMGGDDADEIHGAGGDDRLMPNHTTNHLVTRDDGDVVDGGDGADTVEYPFMSTDPRRWISLDDVANDGAQDEGDNVLSSVENIRSTTGDDVLTGSDAGNLLDGGGGNDVIDGRGGPDTFAGGPGSDTANYVDRTTRVVVTVGDAAGDGEDADHNGSGEEGDDVRSDMERVIGGSGGDRMRGTDAGEWLVGAGGDDVIDGGGGNDSVEGNNGDDELTGGAGTDNVIGGPGADLADYSDHPAPVKVTLAGALDDGSAGENDFVAEIENVRGGPADDQLTGNDSGNMLAGGGGQDSLDGRGGPDLVLGDAGNDTVRGGVSNDVLSGGDGTDTVDYAGNETAPEGVYVSLDGAANDGNPTNDSVAGGEPADNVMPDVERLYGTNAVDHLTGGPGAELIAGRGGVDIIDGLAGDDTLDGGPGADEMAGGAGVDTVTYASRTTAIAADVDGAADDGAAADGPAGARDLIGLDVENLIGGAAADVLGGSGGANRLDGRGGDDTLAGGDGPDVLVGGAGAADTVSYAGRLAAVVADLDGAADDGGALDGPAGARDRIMKDVESVAGGEAGDTLTGSPARNRLSGGGGADRLNGGLGPDTLLGGDGIDTVTYAGRAAAVTVDIDGVADDGSGDDGPAGARDNVGVDVENLIGGAGADSLTGSPLANVLSGGPGADSLFGLAGADSFQIRDGVSDAQTACGADGDLVTADLADPAAADCERVNRR
jgi:Ca2+-binding RTX toxin-like protein